MAVDRVPGIGLVKAIDQNACATIVESPQRVPRHRQPVTWPD
jgi:hypothetical protein